MSKTQYIKTFVVLSSQSYCFQFLPVSNVLSVGFSHLSYRLSWIHCIWVQYSKQYCTAFSICFANIIIRKFMFHLCLIVSSCRASVAEEGTYALIFMTVIQYKKPPINFSLILPNYQRFPSLFDGVHKMPKFHEVSLPTCIIRVRTILIVC